MKNKILVGGVLCAVLLIAGTAFAEDRGQGADGNQIEDRPALAQTKVEGDLEVKTNISVEGRVPRPQDLGKLEDGQDANGEDNASGTLQIREQEQNREQERERSATSSTGEQNREREQNREQERSATSTEDGNATSTEGERQREEHRSEVAKAVQELLSVADRDGGIGEEVRAIARAQEENHAKINDSLKKVEERGAIAKFFFGADQGEIDKAKQIVATNEAQIQQLTELKARMATGTDQEIIDRQIKLLENVNVSASTTLSVHEGGFSLFGWMFRIFGR